MYLTFEAHRPTVVHIDDEVILVHIFNYFLIQFICMKFALQLDQMIQDDFLGVTHLFLGSH